MMREDQICLIELGKQILPLRGQDFQTSSLIWGNLLIFTMVFQIGGKGEDRPEWAISAGFVVVLNLTRSSKAKVIGLMSVRTVHVCPKEDREAIEQENEIFGFLTQSHISSKNVSRLRKLASSQNDRISELADIVLEVEHVQIGGGRDVGFVPLYFPFHTKYNMALNG